MIYICRRDQYDSEREKEKERERKRKKKRKKTRKEKKRRKEERRRGERKKKRKRMATASVFVGVSEREGRCPLHAPRDGWVCVEAGHFLATARKWRVCHERVECVRRAIEGWVDERWVLEHPSPTPDIPTLMDLPPVVGWVCVPKDVFEADTAKLTAATLELARLQLELEKEEEEERRRLAIPVPPPFQVSEIGRVTCTDCGR